MRLTVKRGGLVERTLRGVTLYRTSDRDRAERSRFAYDGSNGAPYRLTLLGFLHGAIGLTLWVKDRP